MPKMTLKSAYNIEEAPAFLYELLAQRDPSENISHRSMPTFPQHVAFMSCRPYRAWYLIELDDSTYIGSVYLTKNREIGIWILKEHQRQGYARMAIDLLKLHHPGRFLANIAPGNDASRAMFETIGFKHIQNTFSLED